MTNPRYISAVGRRKSAVATVKLFIIKGDSQVNGQKLENYFPGDLSSKFYRQPFEITQTAKYHFQAKITGGGKRGQLTALTLALSRALLKSNPDLRVPLKSANLLTVDSRVRQRRMVGMAGKSRRRKQSPKR